MKTITSTVTERAIRTKQVVCAALVLAGMIPGIAKAEWLDLDESTAVASSQLLGLATRAPQYAFDGDTGTRWSSERLDNQWIYVDLGQDYELQKVQIDWETAHSTAYKLLVRTAAQGANNDPANWTQIASVSGRSGLAGTGGAADDLFDFDTTTFTPLIGTATSSSVTSAPVGRYLMVYGLTRTNEWGHSIWEVDVDAVAVPEPSTFVLICFGLVGAVIIAWRQHTLR